MTSVEIQHQNQYYLFVDILKGIAILLIIYGHVIPGAIPVFTDYVSTFHIPLFFFVSGLLFNNEKYTNSFSNFFKKRVQGLILPFLYLSIIVAGLYYFAVDDYVKFVTILLSDGWGGYALWFIPVLICVELIYLPISNLNKGVRTLCLIVSAILSYLSAQYFGYISNNILLVFCGFFFYGIGNLLRKPVLSLNKTGLVRRISLALFGLLVSLSYLFFTNKLPEWFINNIPSPIYYITPFGAICLLISISLLFAEYLNKRLINVIATCGKYSLILLAFHQIICMVVKGIVPSKITILIMIVVLVVLVNIIPRYTPWLIGKR